MKIRYKMLEHERTEDAPFVGALICAIDCNLGCPKCFNQCWRKKPILIKEDIDIIKEIKQNPFNKGIIFSGLEWSMQPTELAVLVKLALENDLQVMIYTGLPFISFMQRVPSTIFKRGVYIKYGNYDEEQKAHNYYKYGVKLSSWNQNITRLYYEK